MKGLRSISIKFGAFAVIAVMLSVLLLNTMVNRLSGARHTYTAEFVDVSGLRIGDDVRVAGVRVGRVAGIRVTGGGAEVDLEVVAEQPVLATTRLVMRYQNLLGQRYLALVQRGKRGEVLRPGTRIPLARTSPGFDLTELLNGFRPLFETLRPEDVNALAGSVVKVLQGESGTMEALLTQTARLTATISDRDEVYDEVLANLTPVLRTLNARGDQLYDTVVELRMLMDGLAKDRKAIGRSIDGMSALIGTTSRLFAEVEDPAAEAVPRFRRVMELFLANEKPFVDSVREFEKGLSALGRAGSYESALNVYVCSAALTLGAAKINLNLSEDGPWSKVCTG